MITTLADLKDLILWAKNQKIKNLEVAGVKVEFSDLAFIGEYEDLLTAKNPTNTSVISPGVHEPHELAATAAEDDDLLFYSAQ